MLQKVLTLHSFLQRGNAAEQGICCQTIDVNIVANISHAVVAVARHFAAAARAAHCAEQNKWKKNILNLEWNELKLSNYTPLRKNTTRIDWAQNCLPSKTQTRICTPFRGGKINMLILTLILSKYFHSSGERRKDSTK